MPTKKKATTKTTPHVSRKSEVAVHTFMGGALALLLVLAVAQFALLRIVWERVEKGSVQEQEITVAPEVKTASVTTTDFLINLPTSLYLYLHKDQKTGGVEYTIGSGTAALAVLYEANLPGARSQQVNTGGDMILKENAILVQAGRTFQVEYWYRSDLTDAQMAEVEEVKKAVQSIELLAVPTVAVQ